IQGVHHALIAQVVEPCNGDGVVHLRRDMTTLRADRIHLGASEIESAQVLVGPDIEGDEQAGNSKNGQDDLRNYARDISPFPCHRILLRRKNCTEMNSEMAMTDAKYTIALPESTPRIKSTCCADRDRCIKPADREG